MRHPASTVPACLLIALLSSACSSFKPVTTFAVQTKAVSTSYEPILSNAMHSCTNTVQRTSIIADRPFQPVAATQDAQTRCQSYLSALAALAQLNMVLQRYAEVLISLSSDELSNSKDEFGALGSALTGLPKGGGDASLLDASKVERIIRLSELISRVATQRQQQAGITELLAREDDIRLISDTLRTYAQQNYRDNLRDETEKLLLLDRALDNNAAREPLAANTLRARIHLDRLQLAERGKQVAAYSDAIDEMQRSLTALRSKPLNDPQLSSQLALFAGKVATLQRQSALTTPVTW